MKKLFSVILIVSIFFALIIPLNLVNANNTSTKNLEDIEGHWAENEIYSLVDLGIIHGYPDGSFKPDNHIRVDEFIKLVISALEINLVYPEEERYGYWAEPYLFTASEYNIIPYLWGIKPKDYLTREVMAYIIIRAYYNTDTPEFHNIGYVNKNKFTDLSNVEYDTAVDDILLAYGYGLMNGTSETTFSPEKYATRAEASTVIVRLLNPKNYLLDNIPYTYVSGNKIDNKDRWNYIGIQNKYYAPINDKGNPVEEVITLHDEIKKIEKQDYGYFEIMYNPFRQSLVTFFYPKPRPSNFDMTFVITDTYFKEGYYPYNLVIWRDSEHHSDMTTYYSYLEDRYGNFFNVYANVLFEKKADYFLERLEKDINNTKQGIPQEDKFILNNRNVYIGTNNGITVYISDKISE